MIIQNIFRKCCPVCINGEYKHSKLLIEYHLSDNDVKIDLGHLLFVKHFSNDWFIGDELFIDKGKGIIDKIYNKWFNFGGSCYQEKSVKELKKNISSNTNGILDSILKNIKRNEKELKTYINNDLDKLKSLLILLVIEFDKNRPKL